jgi:hypothetical protein
MFAYQIDALQFSRQFQPMIAAELHSGAAAIRGKTFVLRFSFRAFSVAVATIVALLSPKWSRLCYPFAGDLLPEGIS